MAFTCRADPSDWTTPAILEIFIGEHLIEKQLLPAALDCKPHSIDAKERRAWFRPSFTALWSVMLREAEKKWRVGALAPCPFPRRCPPAAPHPFPPDYAPSSHTPKGSHSHTTG